MPGDGAFALRLPTSGYEASQLPRESGKYRGCPLYKQYVALIIFCIDIELHCKNGQFRVIYHHPFTAMADLVIDYEEMMRTIHLEDRQLFFLQCAMEENCLASQAYQIQKENSYNWHLETRRLLRFTARIMNIGTADFRPFVPKHLWEWHACHM